MIDADHKAEGPTVRQRVVFALLIAAACAAYTIVRGVRSPALITDLDHLMFGARQMLAGNNPYLDIGPGKTFEWPFPLYYPATTLVLVAPFALAPLLVARAAFAAISGGALAYSITRSGWTHAPLFLSAAFVTAIGRNQWSPLLLAACVMPLLGFVSAAKPNIGLATFAAQRSSVALGFAVAGAVALGLISLAIRPGWPLEWLAMARIKRDALIPAAQWIVAGPLLLLAGLRWRRAESRLLLALAVTPQSPFVYDTLPLLAVARTSRQALLLALATDVAMFGQLALGATTSRDDAHVRLMAAVTTACVFLPCAALVLMRPNAGSAVGDTDSNRSQGTLDRVLWIVNGSVFVVFVFAIVRLGA